MKRLLLVFLLFSYATTLLAQTENSSHSEEEAPTSTPFCSAVMGWTFPKGDMGNKYQSFMNLNANIGWKTNDNWVWMIEFGFAFGSDNIKIKNDILSEIMTNEGYPFVISREGSDAGVVAYNRNLSLVGKVGKVIPLFKKRPNSGILLKLGGGLLQHQIIYQSTLEIANQLEGDYQYLYDRQMRGIMLSGFVGYLHMGKSNFANFYIGLEFNQAFTKMTRKYQVNFDGDYNKINLDQMWTLKIGWMFPFYGKNTDKEYYY
jgi:hypothetical protein